MISYFQHSKLSKIDEIINKIQNGSDIALVTDAGTPAISDPGVVLISEIKKINGNIVPVPGPSALTAAVSVSGLVGKDFYFAGFLPKKKGRQTEFKRLVGFDCPIVVYESANRLERTLGDIRTYFGDKVTVFIGREMTKMHEEYWQGDIVELISTLKSHTLKGELVLVISQL